MLMERAKFEKNVLNFAKKFLRWHLRFSEKELMRTRRYGNTFAK